MAEHTIVHVEIPAQNPQAASKFYANLFGWKMEVDLHFNYHMFQAPSGPDGAFSEVSENVKPGNVLIYVSTDDIDASLEKAVSLGGTVAHPKMEIPGVGWMAIFTDPTGNLIGLFAPNM